MSTLTLDERVIRRVGGSIESQLAEAVLEDARAVVREQAYRTGRLHDGLAMEVDGGDVRVVSTAPYSRYVHDGTVDTEAVPFLRQAATRVGSRADELVRLISDLWHECGVIGGTGDPPVLIRNAWADLVAKPIEDPGLKRPYATCYVDVLGGAEPKGVPVT